MRKNIFLTLIALMISSTTIFSQKGVEVLSPSPIANVVTDAVIINKTTAWASGTLGSVMRTTDAGLTWQTVRSGEDIWLNSISAVDNDKAWVTGPNDILSSTSDGGKTWKNEKVGKFAYLSKVQFVDSQNGFVAGTAILTDDQADAIYQLYSTSDGGKTWKMRNASLGFSPLEIHFTSVNNGYAIERYDPVTGMDKLLRTTDGGKTWAKVIAFENLKISSMSFPDTKNGYVLAEVTVNSGENPTSMLIVVQTGDGGKTWKSDAVLEDPIPTRDGMPHFIYFKDNKTGWVIKSNEVEASVINELFKTVDGGKSWQKMISNTETGFSRIAFFDDNTGVVFPGFWYLIPLIHRTTDGGQTFTQLVKGNDLHFNVFQFVNPQTVFAVSDKGIVKSTDSGNNWNVIKEVKGAFFSNLKFFSEKEGLAVCYDDSGSTILYSTVDGGNNWSNSTIKFKGYPQSLFFVDLKTFFAFSIEQDKRTLMRSDDGGKTWKEMMMDTSPDGQFMDLFFVDKNNGWVVGEAILPGATKNGGMVPFIKNTTDGGTSWSETYLNDQVYPQMLRFLDRDNGWYVSTVNDTSLALNKTTDGGKKWESFLLGAAYDLLENVQFQDPMNGWMLKAYGAPLSPSFIYRTKNGGKTWELYKTTYKIEKLQFIDKNTIYGGGYSNLIKITVD